MKPSQPSPRPAPPHHPRQPRATLKVEVGIDDLDAFDVGFVENVSSGGIFVSSYRRLPIGTRVAMTFVLPDQSTLFVHGVVRWVRDAADRATSEVEPGMGIQFLDLGEADAERLQAYVASHLPSGQASPGR